MRIGNTKIPGLQSHPQGLNHSRPRTLESTLASPHPSPHQPTTPTITAIPNQHPPLWRPDRNIAPPQVIRGLQEIIVCRPELWNTIIRIAQSYRLPSYFEIDPATLNAFFIQLKLLQEIILKNDVETPANFLASFLEQLRGQSRHLTMINSLIVSFDDQKNLYRSVQTLTEVLNISLWGHDIYDHLKMPMANWEFLYTDKPEATARISISDSPYSLELQPGCHESFGGLTFALTDASRELLAKIGILAGDHTIYIVQLQGGARLRPQAEQLKMQLNGRHPFDWLLGGVFRWASSAGYRHMRGYGYCYNHWVMTHIQNGDFPPEREGHMGKIYDKRFLSFGMKRVPGLTNVYEIPLSAMHPADGSENDNLIGELINGRERESVDDEL